MGENNYIFSFFTYFIFYLIDLILFLYNLYNSLIDEICISFFMLLWLQLLKNFISLFIENMEEKLENISKIKNEGDNQLQTKNNIQNKIAKAKYFSYGLILSGLFTFFISGGINSFLFIILFCLIINNNFFILKEKNLVIQYLFIIFCYSILPLRANFIDLTYTIIFFVNYRNVLYKEYIYINLILNAFFFINFNYFNLILFIFSMLSFIFHFKDKKIKIIEKQKKENEEKESEKNEEKKNEKKNEENEEKESEENEEKESEEKEKGKNEENEKENEEKKNEEKKNEEKEKRKNEKKKNEINFSVDGKIYILNFLILSTLFIQTKGYECQETLIIFSSLLFQMLILLIKKKFFMETIIYTLPIIFCISIDNYFIENKFYNQKGVWINILYYLYFLIF